MDVATDVENVVDLLGLGDESVVEMPAIAVTIRIASTPVGESVHSQWIVMGNQTTEVGDVHILAKIHIAISLT